jgi:hypothetical protein
MKTKLFIIVGLAIISLNCFSQTHNGKKIYQGNTKQEVVNKWGNPNDVDVEYKDGVKYEGWGYDFNDGHWTVIISGGRVLTVMNREHTVEVEETITIEYSSDNN